MADELLPPKVVQQLPAKLEDEKKATHKPERKDEAEGSGLTGDEPHPLLGVAALMAPFWIPALLIGVALVIFLVFVS